MGMDLKPMRPTKDAPCYPADYEYAAYRGRVIWGRYNWSGWGWLTDHLAEWGDVDMSHFAGSNDGALIPAKVCRQVADSLEKHLPELSSADRDWIAPHVQLWRTCGGYRQY